jgi:hypothetical protein
MMEMSKPKKLKNVKGDDRRWLIQDAAHDFKRYAELKNRIKQIKSDPALLKEVKAYLQKEIAETKQAMKS